MLPKNIVEVVNTQRRRTIGMWAGGALGLSALAFGGTALASGSVNADTTSDTVATVSSGLGDSWAHISADTRTDIVLGGQDHEDDSSAVSGSAAVDAGVEVESEDAASSSSATGDVDLGTGLLIELDRGVSVSGDLNLGLGLRVD